MGHRIRIEKATEGTSILQALQARGEYILAPCGGNGTCGKCRVRFVQDPPAPSQADRKVLTEAEIADGVRLACRTAAVQGAVIEIEAGDEKQMDVASGFTLDGASGRVPVQRDIVDGEKDTEEGGTIAAAVDIGTTTIAMSAVDIGSGRILGTSTGINHQRSWGADVISRMEASNQGKGALLQKSIRADLDLLREGFNNRWIDVYENVGKRGGAYSSGSSRPHPYVLLNHKDTLDSMFTLAHEMGHALHSYYSCHNQPVCDSDYVIFVAEVASTCNEVLLMRYLLGRTEDRKERAYLINHFLDHFKGTVYRQTMFAEFELEMGRMSEAGETLTAQTLCEKYRALNELYFGPDMVSDEQIALEWARIPHFFYDYYVFQYATGFSAAVAIANRILSEGAPAVADYKRVLSGGSSTDPISLLKIAGVDMSGPEPVNSALALFGELLDEMEKLMA